ncbi:hypothetical protein ACK9YZ_16980 [Rhizobium sp. ZK1]|uniref:hypothetical protein n=1 Tax=Rhizobium sp. ZK1 TaxID=3389872 RepID=UPI0039F6E397
MSDNPALFDFLRHEAYGFVNRAGKDLVGLREHLQLALDRSATAIERKNDLSDREVAKIIDDVCRWTINRYNPPKRKPARTSEQRAADYLLVAELHEMTVETGKPSVRRTAAISGRSKSTVSRHLIRQGVAPRRSKKVKSLTQPTRKLISVLDETFHRRDAGLIDRDALAAAVWGSGREDKVAKSTLSSRRKRLSASVRELSAAGVGYSLLEYRELIAVQRGRRFRSYKDAALWIDDELRTRGKVMPRLPRAEPSPQLFWADRWVRDVIAIMRLGCFGRVTSVAQLEPVLRIMHLLLDLTSLYPWLRRAVDSFHSTYFPDNLHLLADRIENQVTRRAARDLAHALDRFFRFNEYMPPVFDMFQNVDIVFDVLAKAGDIDPQSRFRLEHLRDHVFWGEERDFLELEPYLSALAEQELKGQWHFPGYANEPK